MKKKTKINFYLLLIMGVYLIQTNSCKKDEKENNSTQTPKTVSDIDGNVYHTITIGAQVWMVENLKVTHYRNEDPIPNVTEGTEWSNLTSGAYCDYDNIPSNSITYGKLYNWYAVSDSRNIAPVGWHVATDAEWTTLTTFLGGDSVAGGKLKEAGTTHWQSPNSAATNESGFTALPGGSRGGKGTANIIDGKFNFIGGYGRWWTATEYNASSGRYILLGSWYEFVSRIEYYKELGLSVRCIMD